MVRDTQYVIRSAGNDDLPGIRSLLLAVRGEFDVVDETGVSDVDLEDLERDYFARGGTFEVVQESGGKEIVGCAALYPLSPSRVELCKMYLLKSARGRGLGKRLLDRLLAAARAGGFREVWLETNSSLTAAATLYERNGFQRVKADRLLPKCDRAYLLRLS